MHFTSFCRCWCCLGNFSKWNWALIGIQLTLLLFHGKFMQAVLPVYCMQQRPAIKRFPFNIYARMNYARANVELHKHRRRNVKTLCNLWVTLQMKVAIKVDSTLKETHSLFHFHKILNGCLFQYQYCFLIFRKTMVKKKYCQIYWHIISSRSQSTPKQKYLLNVAVLVLWNYYLFINRQVNKKFSRFRTCTHITPQITQRMIASKPLVGVSDWWICSRIECKSEIFLVQM